MLDMVRPQQQGQITLRDLKACKMTDIFFDTFFNLDNFLEHEQRDPFANVQVSEKKLKVVYHKIDKATRHQTAKVP